MLIVIVFRFASLLPDYQLSREETPDGSGLAFAQDDIAPQVRGSILIHSITEWPSLFPSSFTRIPIGLLYSSLSPRGEIRAYHVPLEYLHGVGLAYLPMVQRLWQVSK